MDEVARTTTSGKDNLAQFFTYGGDREKGQCDREM